MSYCFYIQAVKAPSLAEWLNACALPDVIRVQGKNNPWPESSQFFCRKLLSTRGILLSHKDARLEIRTNILSAPADYQLAFSLATAAAKMTGKEIVPESAQAMNVETFMSVHDDKWILDMNLSNVRSLRAIIDEGNTFSIPGPFRNTLLGPQKLKQLTAATETDTLQNLLALLLRMQWLQEEGIHCASQLTAQKGGEKPRTLAIWFPKKGGFLPLADQIIIDNNGELIKFPFDSLPTIAGEYFQLLDESQPLISPIPDANIPVILQLARSQQK